MESNIIKLPLYKSYKYYKIYNINDENISNENIINKEKDIKNEESSEKIKIHKCNDDISKILGKLPKSSEIPKSRTYDGKTFVNNK